MIRQLTYNKTCIMLVDDDPSMLHTTAMILEEEGYHVLICGGGKEAIDKFNDTVFAVILDITMADMSGLDVFEIIKSKNQYIPIIFYSGSDEKEKRTNIRKHFRPHAYVVKGSDPQQLLDTVAGAIESYKNMKHINIEAIFMLARACEVRDEDTGKHVLRINHYSIALAQELDMDESFIKELGPASLLHDVGKIHIPDNILRKRGHFTNEEREEMKKHPLYGDRILGESKFFQLAMEITRWHHENWDGTGYPDGLVGETIPVSARIVRLVDTYDALVTTRPYKEAWTDEAAYHEITTHSSTYFDPKMVEAFHQLFKKGVFQDIKNTYL